MSDTGSSTRIMDLPDPNSGKLPQYTNTVQPTFSGYGGQTQHNTGIHGNDVNTQSNQGQGQGQGQGQMNGYIQMNVHPNPYGTTPPQNNMIPLPQHTSNHKPSGNANPYLGNPSSGSNDESLTSIVPQYTLPSRDIPMDTTSYVQDESIKANYIPPSTRSRLGLEEDEDDYLPKPKKGKREKKEKKVHFADDWMVEWQRPILVAMLYFLFQMPMLNVLMLKYLKVLKMFGEDGNLNYVGFTFKSIVFGVGVYGIEYFI